MPEKELDIRIDDQYRVLRRLGSGGYGVVYEGVDVKTDQHVAIKLERLRSDHSEHLDDEVAIYQELAGGPGIPQVYWSGEECDYRVMVFELLGPSLEDLFNYCNRTFSLHTVLMLADQLIRRFQYIHSKGFVHRDIKPENILMGMGRQGNLTYITDIGLAERFTDSGWRVPALGTPRYASISAHRGVAQTPPDDMEALGYVFVYFLRGELPWQGLRHKRQSEKEKAIQEKKESMSPEELCKDLPEEFAKYFHHVKMARDKEQDVDYKHLLQQFRKLFYRRGFEYDHVYDWTILKYIEYQKLHGQQPGKSDPSSPKSSTSASQPSPGDGGEAGGDGAS